MNSMFIAPGIVDGAVVHKKAQMRLTDKYRPAETEVHAHRQGSNCNDRCVVYKFPQKVCPDCDGFGRFKMKKATGTGLATKLVDEKCSTCGGVGEIRDPNKNPGDEDEAPDQGLEV